MLTPLILPLLVQRFVGEAEKGTYLGIMRLWALMAALLVQALMGLLSDRSTSHWGRRWPFIVVGTLCQLAVLTLIGLSTGLTGMTGYWVLFLLNIPSMFASDTAHAATQGLIPDLVPEENRGRASGLKVLLELPLPLIFVSFVIARLVAAGNLWAALVALMVVLVVCMLVTMLVREKPLEEPPFKLDWRPILRLFLMVAAFTAINLAGFVLFFLQERYAGLDGERAAGPAAMAVMFVGIFVLLTALPAGWLADRVGKQPLVLVAALLAAGGVFLFLAVPSLAMLYVGASLLGAGAGLFYAANWALGTEIVPQEQAGRYLGISNLAGAGAGAVGAYIGGPIADHRGYGLLFAIYGVLFLLSTLALLGIRDPKLGKIRA